MGVSNRQQKLFRKTVLLTLSFWQRRTVGQNSLLVRSLQWAKESKKAPSDQYFSTNNFWAFNKSNKSVIRSIVLTWQQKTLLFQTLRINCKFNDFRQQNTHWYFQKICLGRVKPIEKNAMTSGSNICKRV